MACPSGSCKEPISTGQKRLCVDYSQTINQYTELDAYPLPRIDDMNNNLAHYKVFSTFDLRNAYHQVPILKMTESIQDLKPMAAYINFDGYLLG